MRKEQILARFFFPFALLFLFLSLAFVLVFPILFFLSLPFCHELMLHAMAGWFFCFCYILLLYYTLVKMQQFQIVQLIGIRVGIPYMKYCCAPPDSHSHFILPQPLHSATQIDQKSIILWLYLFIERRKGNCYNYSIRFIWCSDSTADYAI